MPTKIIVLDNGEIVGYGINHADLIQTCPVYLKLLNLNTKEELANGPNKIKKACIF